MLPPDILTYTPQPNLLMLKAPPATQVHVSAPPFLYKKQVNEEPIIQEITEDDKPTRTTPPSSPIIDPGSPIRKHVIQKTPAPPSPPVIESDTPDPQQTTPNDTVIPTPAPKTSVTNMPTLRQILTKTPSHSQGLNAAKRFKQDEHNEVEESIFKYSPLNLYVTEHTVRELIRNPLTSQTLQEYQNRYAATSDQHQT